MSDQYINLVPANPTDLVTMPIYGSGGGGGGKGRGKNRRPKEHRDTLEVKSEINVLYLLGEGEIQGVDDLYKQVYLDDTPVQNADGTFNYDNVKLYIRNGTLNQSHIPGFAEVENEIPVSTQVKKSIGSVTRTLNNGDADAVRVRIMTPSLQKIDSSTGDIKPTAVSFMIEISTAGGAWIERVRDTISGKASSPYERFYRINLPRSPNNQWQIRVTRLTDDSDSQKKQNDIYWQSYTVIVDSKLRYPNTALLGMRLSAEQFSSLPRVSIKYKGKKILVPSNYDPIARKYTGFWDGTFRPVVYSNNPVWVLFDLLINTRYGCGKHISADSLDKISFYAAAQYCDELVPNGLGGWEPRFIFNGSIDDSEDAYSKLSKVASVFRGSLYWAQGTIYLNQDRPEEPVKIFTRANVIEDRDENGNIVTPCFNYSGTAKSARHTSALVRYTNPDLLYKDDVEYVPLFDSQSRYGDNRTRLDAFACTSQSQARRLGLWTLLTEYYLTDTVTFRVGLDGSHLSPGNVVLISDPLRSVSNQGGRVKEVLPNDHIVLDTSLSLLRISAGDEITYQTVLGIYKTRIVAINTSDPGSSQLLIRVTPNSNTPFIGAVWVLTNVDLKPAKYRIYSVVDKFDGDRPHYEVTAIQYNDSLYRGVDFGDPIEIPPTRVLPPVVPNKPYNVTALVAPLLRENKWMFVLKGSWDVPLLNGNPDPYTSYYEVNYRHGTHGQWIGAATTPSNTVEYPDVVEDIYYLRVRAVDILNRYSAWVESVQLICKRPTPPNPIGTGRVTLTQDNAVVISWSDTQSYPYGITGYTVKIREGQNGDFVPFQNVPLGTYYTNRIVRPPGLYFVHIKPLDRTGQESDEAIEVVIGAEFAPPSPSGSIEVELNLDETLRLFWTDKTVYPASFKGYVVYKNDEKILVTENTFTPSLRHDNSVDAIYTIKSYNTLNYESVHGLILNVPAGSLNNRVPNPVGSITKVLAVDGGVILRWSDTQIYPKGFEGYKVFIDGKLHTNTPITECSSVTLPPTKTYSVLVKPYLTGGWQSSDGLRVDILPSDYIPPAPSYMLVDQSSSGNKQFYWGMPSFKVPDLKLFRIKYTVGSYQNWEEGHFIKDVLPESLSFDTNLFREGIYTVMVKSVDITGYESNTFTFTTVNLGDPIPDNVVEAWCFDTPSESDPSQSYQPWMFPRAIFDNMQVVTNDQGKKVLRKINPALPCSYTANYEPTQEGDMKLQVKALGNYKVEYQRSTQGVLWTGTNDPEALWTVAREDQVLWKAQEIWLPFPIAVQAHIEEYLVRVVWNAGEAELQNLKVIVDAPDIESIHPDVTVSATTGARVVPYKPMTFMKAVVMNLQDVGTTARSLYIAQKDPVQGALIFARDANGNNVAAVIDVRLVGY